MRFKKISILGTSLFICMFFVQCKKHSHAHKEFVDPLAASFTNMQEHIFKHSCNSSGCHNSGAINNLQHGLVLEGVDVYERLINISPKNAEAKAAGIKLVVPKNADSSFLFTKCAWTTFKFGNQMPLGADALSVKEIEFIKQWINAGAPKTGVVADYTLLKDH